MPTCSVVRTRIKTAMRKHWPSAYPSGVRRVLYVFGERVLRINPRKFIFLEEAQQRVHGPRMRNPFGHVYSGNISFL